MQLGEMLEVSQTFVGKLERGAKLPNLVMLLKITQIFNVSADLLINDVREIDDWPRSKKESRPLRSDSLLLTAHTFRYSKLE